MLSAICFIWGTDAGDYIRTSSKRVGPLLVHSHTLLLAGPTDRQISRRSLLRLARRAAALARRALPRLDVGRGLHLAQPGDGAVEGELLVLAREERVLREPLARVGANLAGGARLGERVGGDADGVELGGLARLPLELEPLEGGQVVAPPRRAAEEILDGRGGGGDQARLVVVQLVD